MRNATRSDKIPGSTRRAIIAVLLVISLVGGSFAAYKASDTILGYLFADIEHKELVKEAVDDTEDEDTEEPLEIEEGEEPSEIQVITMGGDEMPIRLPRINHKKLQAMNPDYFGWLYIPYSNINYPVCLGSDDSWYLNHTFKGKENSSGCLFLNSKTKQDDSVWFIYGHNMKNESMFGELDEISKSGVNKMFLICPKTTYELRLYSAHYAKANSETYSIPQTSKGMRAYYDKELKASEKLFSYAPSISDKTVVLSTCHGETGGDGRYVLLGASKT